MKTTSPMAVPCKFGFLSSPGALPIDHSTRAARTGTPVGRATAPLAGGGRLTAYYSFLETRSTAPDDHFGAARRWIFSRDRIWVRFLSQGSRSSLPGIGWRVADIIGLNCAPVDRSRCLAQPNHAVRRS